VSAPPAALPATITPGSYEQLADCVRDAEAARSVLHVAGCGNHLRAGAGAGAPPALLSLRGLPGVVHYEPADFTISVQAGMLLSDLKALLAKNGQELPVDFALSPEGSVGGAIAQNRSGPRRGRYGGLRSHLIGVKGMRGGGRIWRAGGMVVKNVAGYDVMKLLAGSRGTLGPILEANLRLRPVPAARSARRARFRAAAGAFALARTLRARALEPAALLVLDPAADGWLDAALADPLSWTGGLAAEPLEPESRPAAGAWSLLWAFEGNAGAVRWLEGEVDRLLPEAKADAVAAIEAGAYATALDVLASLRSPGPPSSRPAIALSIAGLPSRAEAIAGALEELRLGAMRRGRLDGALDRGLLVTDAASGIHTLHLGLGGSRENRREEALARLEEAGAAAARLSANGRVLAAPIGLGDLEGRPLAPDPNAAIAERVRRVFDPAGAFAGPGGGPPPS